MWRAQFVTSLAVIHPINFFCLRGRNLNYILVVRQAKSGRHLAVRHGRIVPARVFFDSVLYWTLARHLNKNGGLSDQRLHKIIHLILVIFRRSTNVNYSPGESECKGNTQLEVAWPPEYYTYLALIISDTIPTY